MMNEELNKKLSKIQSGLKAPKGQYNSFGRYHYRSAEDILEAVKPLLAEHGLTLTIRDNVEQIGDRYYVVAVAAVSDGKDEITATAYAREPQNKKGMDEAQITGATSSYARKYALNGLFAIDDTKDADAPQGQEQRKEAKEKSTALISTAQAKRMFAIAKGKNALVREVLKKYNYESSKEIHLSNYDAICSEIEQRVSADGKES